MDNRYSACVEVKSGLIDLTSFEPVLEVRNWLYEEVGNPGHEWDYNVEATPSGFCFRFAFTYETDAIMFKLRWVG